jgi:hypothetical protein
LPPPQADEPSTVRADEPIQYCVCLCMSVSMCVFVCVRLRCHRDSPQDLSARAPQAPCSEQHRASCNHSGVPAGGPLIPRLTTELQDGGRPSWLCAACCAQYATKHRHIQANASAQRAAEPLSRGRARLWLIGPLIGLCVSSGRTGRGGGLPAARPVSSPRAEMGLFVSLCVSAAPV